MILHIKRYLAILFCKRFKYEIKAKASDCHKQAWNDIQHSTTN